MFVRLYVCVIVFFCEFRFCWLRVCVVGCLRVCALLCFCQWCDCVLVCLGVCLMVI